MTHVILLDDYQDRVTDGHYAVTYEGTLPECLAQTHHDGSTFVLRKADYREGGTIRPTLRDGLDNPDEGVILELAPRGGLAALEAAATPKRRPSGPARVRRASARPGR